MQNNFKDIHIGLMIRQKTIELGLETSRICNFIACDEEDIEKMFQEKDLTTNILLKWSKLLKYDFFRVYSHHLILHAPPGNMKYNDVDSRVSMLPRFRKNIYTKEVIAFILELIDKGEKTKKQVIEEYRIPKTTLHKWITKHSKYKS